MSSINGPQGPSTSHITDNLKRQIHYMLQNENISNALWLSERLYAYDTKSEEAHLLLAKCYTRLGDQKQAHEILKQDAKVGKHLGCAYAYAQACLALDKISDGISALERTRLLWISKTAFNSSDNGPDAAAVYALLAKLYIKHNDLAKALKASEEALKLNPFLFDTFTGVCDTGTSRISPDHAFRFTKEMELYTQSHPGNPDSSVLHSAENSQGSGSGLTAAQTANRPSSRINASVQHDDPFATQPASRGGGGLFGSYRPESSLNFANSQTSSEFIDTPISEETSAAKPTSVHPATTTSRLRKQPVSVAHAPSRTTRAPPAPLFGAPKRTHAGFPVTQPQHDDATGPVRRSQRLNPQEAREARDAREVRRPPTASRLRTTTTATASTTSTASRTGATSRRQAHPTIAEDDHRNGAGRRTAAVAPVPEQIDIKTQLQQQDDAKHVMALGMILETLRIYGRMYLQASQFRINEAVDHFMTLPRSHQETPWALSVIARGFYEGNNYQKSYEFFQRLRKYAPFRHEDMEIYSTVLWHLKKEAELSFLAHELIDQNWVSPQAWCALGNAQSLLREHEQALKCFDRATQLKPNFAIAFTLQGHENIANEELNKAQTAYHKAIAAEPRHYTAYYGLAKVYEKQGELDKAFQHYQTASMINPVSAILLVNIGTICEKKKEVDAALAFFDRAILLDPRKPLSRFKRARCLMQMGRFSDSYLEMTRVVDMAPDEALVHFLYARLCHALGKKEGAIKHYTICMTLDPKASPQVKEFMEDLDGEVGEGDVSMLMV